MSGFVVNMTEFVLNVNGFVINTTRILNMAVFCQTFTGLNYDCPKYNINCPNYSWISLICDLARPKYNNNKTKKGLHQL